MSNWVSYQGKPIGRIKLNDNNTYKFVYIAEGLDSLIRLFQLNPDDEVEVEGLGKISYEKFKRDHLTDISGFYSTLEHWLLKNERSKTLEDYEESQKSK